MTGALPSPDLLALQEALAGRYSLDIAPGASVGIARGWGVPGLLITGSAVIAALWGGPMALLALRTRKLLRSGYVLDDIRLALKQDHQRRAEEMAFEHGKRPSRLERFTRWLAFWHGKRGRWLATLVGRGLTALPSVGGPTYRPTELAVGLAADRLYEALPDEVRRQLPDLPEAVRRLESDAQGMRQRVEELNEIVAAVGQDDRGVGQRRDALLDDVRATRDAAQARLADAVAALETIRLDLLRVQAGAGDVASITEDLSAARELSEGISRLLEGQADVELARRRRPRAGLGLFHSGRRPGHRVFLPIERPGLARPGPHLVQAVRVIEPPVLHHHPDRVRIADVVEWIAA